jgi:hypothetical protein
LHSSYNLARRLSLAGLAQSAARAIAEITDVSLHDPDDALRLADAMAAEIGWSPSQEDGRASILLRRGDPAGALAIWRRVIPEWGPRDKFDNRQTFSCREAAIAAAQLEKWAEAADLLAAARERVQTGSDPIYEFGLLMDEGYARWMAGDNRTALARLAAGLSALEHLPSDDADERAFAIRRRAGHALMWVAANAEGAPPKGYSAPPPGCCSSLELIRGPMPASAPSDALWVYLLQFEFAVDLGDALLHAHAARLAKTSDALVRVSFAKLQMQYRLRTLAFEDFVEVALDWVEALEACRGRISPDPSTPVPAYTDAGYQNRFLADFLFAAMLNAIFALVARSQITERIISKWVASAVRAGLSSLLDSWLELARGLFVTGTVDGARAVRDQSLGWSAQMLALIRVAVDHTATPVDVLSVHGLLAVSLSKMKQAIFVVSDIEHIVTSTWLRLSSRRFLLRSPSRTVLEIQRACGSNAKGWKKFSKVLAAAEDATPARLPDIYREAIRKLAEDS